MTVNIKLAAGRDLLIEPVGNDMEDRAVENLQVRTGQRTEGVQIREGSRCDLLLANPGCWIHVD